MDIKYLPVVGNPLLSERDGNIGSNASTDRHVSQLRSETHYSLKEMETKYGLTPKIYP